MSGVFTSAKEDVFVVVCLFATLGNNFRTDLHEIFKQKLAVGQRTTD